MKEFQGKVAVVTGAASGIGKALAKAFGARGMRVVLADIEEKSLEAAADEVRAAGAEALAVVTDVADEGSVSALADAAFHQFGAVHVLCNNAGVLLVGPMIEAGKQDWEWILNVNLWGVIHGIRAFVPRMIASGEAGHIVNTASMAGMVPPDNHGIYNVSKFAVVGLTESLARDLRHTKLGVSMLCPGVVDTGIFTSERNRPSQHAAANAGEVPKVEGARVIGPDDVAQTVIQGIEAGTLHIYTHGEIRTWLEKHNERRLRGTYGA